MFHSLSLYPEIQQSFSREAPVEELGGAGQEVWMDVKSGDLRLIFSDLDFGGSTWDKSSTFSIRC